MQLRLLYYCYLSESSQNSVPDVPEFPLPAPVRFPLHLLSSCLLLPDMPHESLRHQVFLLFLHSQKRHFRRQARLHVYRFRFHFPSMHFSENQYSAKCLPHHSLPSEVTYLHDFRLQPKPHRTVLLTLLCFEL